MNLKSEFVIRTAEPGDEAAIHLAHMRSIREVCVKDHGPEEIKGWGNRELGERWTQEIKNHFVCVIEKEETIFGLGYIRIYEKDDQSKSAYLHALYLTPEVIGQGYGKQILSKLFEAAKNAEAKEIILESSITAHAFYLKAGFKDTGPMMKLEVAGYPVSAFPMKLTF
jgi:L-amino acid N-acyltransferase YncA